MAFSSKTGNFFFRRRENIDVFYESPLRACKALDILSALILDFFRMREKRQAHIILHSSSRSTKIKLERYESNHAYELLKELVNLPLRLYDVT